MIVEWLRVVFMVWFLLLLQQQALQCKHNFCHFQLHATLIIRVVHIIMEFSSFHHWHQTVIRRLRKHIISHFWDHFLFHFNPAELPCTLYHIICPCSTFCYPPLWWTFAQFLSPIICHALVFCQVAPRGIVSTPNITIHPSSDSQFDVTTYN